MSTIRKLYKSNDSTSLSGTGYIYLYVYEDPATPNFSERICVDDELSALLEVFFSNIKLFSLAFVRNNNHEYSDLDNLRGGIITLVLQLINKTLELFFVASEKNKSTVIKINEENKHLLKDLLQLSASPENCYSITYKKWKKFVEDILQNISRMKGTPPTYIRSVARNVV